MNTTVGAFSTTEIGSMTSSGKGGRRRLEQHVNPLVLFPQQT
jgi:hypothetical protein